MTEMPRPRASKLQGTVPAEWIVAAGTGRRVDYVNSDYAAPQRTGWTVGDMRALLDTVPASFDSQELLSQCHCCHNRSRVQTASMQPPHVTPNNGFERSSLTLYTA